MHYQPQFKRLACKHWGVLSTYWLTEIINHQKTIMSTDRIDKLGPEGLTVKISTFSHKCTVTNKLGAVTLRNKSVENMGKNFKVKKYIYSSPPASRVWLFHIGAKLCNLWQLSCYALKEVNSKCCLNQQDIIYKYTYPTLLSPRDTDQLTCHTTSPNFFNTWKP